MSDIIDRAARLEQQQREQAIVQSKGVAELPHEHRGHRYCLCCDVELNTKRLLVVPTAVRCIDCQTLYEHQQKNFRERY